MMWEEGSMRRRKKRRVVGSKGFNRK